MMIAGAVATSILIFVAIRYGVVGISCLATYRRDAPLVFWLCFGVLCMMFLGCILSVFGLF